MAENYRTPAVQAAVMIQQFAARDHEGGGHGAARRHPYAQAHGGEAPREHTAHDMASVFGLPVEQVTPELLAALSPLIEELDHMRAQVHRDDRRIDLLAHQAERDCVVPVLNRRAFVRELDAFLTGAQPGGTLTMLHVGGIEALRLAHGLAAGEGALRHVCAAALSVLRATDVIGLLGGSDFAILMPACDAHDARARLAEICRRINDPHFMWLGQPVSLEILYGVHALEQGEGAEQALGAADRKRRGIAG